MEERGGQFQFNGGLIGEIFRKVNDFETDWEIEGVINPGIDYELQTIVRQATVLFCEIAHCQPFLEGNRATAFYAGMVFLHRNGYHLPMTTQRDKDDMFNLLDRTKASTGMIEEAFCQEMLDYLQTRITLTPA
ncbi:MAG TPA: hypothetical protein VJP79_01160 [Nitrososphaera sp.]|nr:hypothetical protein [Nitrososphaera sp.]